MNLLRQIINRCVSQKRSGHRMNLPEDKWPSDQQLRDAVTLEINMMTNMEVIELISEALKARYD